MFVGHDKSGKTTIAEKLSDFLSIPIFNLEGKKFMDWKVILEYSYETQTQIIEQSNYSFIFDRGHPCEWVFSKFFERPTNEELIWDFDDRLANKGCTIIHCYKDEIKELDAEDNMNSVKDIEKIKQLYFDFLDETKCDVLHLNTTNEDIEEQIYKILNYITYGDNNEKI